MELVDVLHSRYFVLTISVALPTCYHIFQLCRVKQSVLNLSLRSTYFFGAVERAHAEGIAELSKGIATCESFASRLRESRIRAGQGIPRKS